NSTINQLSDSNLCIAPICNNDAMISKNDHSIHAGFTRQLCGTAHGGGCRADYIAVQKIKGNTTALLPCFDVRRRHKMVAVAYGVPRAPTAKAAERAKAATPRKSLFARFMDALAESRMKHFH